MLGWEFDLKNDLNVSVESIKTEFVFVPDAKDGHFGRVAAQTVMIRISALGAY